ncbi:MAG: methanethiol S-methyltransferase [Mycobacteriales bacterium]|jgi:protein-S-isoprenylcysteine O-methyltransferase Ste14
MAQYHPRYADRAGRAVAGYAAAAYLLFLAVLVYSIGFFADRGVPKGIDGGTTRPTAAAVVVDLLLLGLFAVQHTVMARPRYKRWWARVAAPAAERATFVVASSLTLVLLFWLWEPIPTRIWHLSGLPAGLLLAGYLAGWALAVTATFQIDHADLFGLRQAWHRLRGTTYRPAAFTRDGLHRHVRHPLMTGFLVVFWLASTMTAGHLLFAAVATGYILIGTSFEERDLQRHFGEDYRRYRAEVPALLPVRLRPRRPAPVAGTRG